MLNLSLLGQAMETTIIIVILAIITALLIIFYNKKKGTVANRDLSR